MLLESNLISFSDLSSLYLLKAYLTILDDFRISSLMKNRSSSEQVYGKLIVFKSKTLSNSLSLIKLTYIELGIKAYFTNNKANIARLISSSLFRILYAPLFKLFNVFSFSTFQMGCQ